MKKFFRITLIVIIVALAIYIYYHFFWVFAEGVKAGQMNYFEKKGFMFKTYEGKLIQAGYKGTAGTIQSNEFRFSVVEESVAQKLSTNSGKQFELHYKQYLGALPWRGASEYVVDSVISMQDMGGGNVPLK
ncbi:MAG TPA: hypothetical protein VMH01_03265 [Puia sp.]|nr:hypothetical protein [Puia sp.]